MSLKRKRSVVDLTTISPSLPLPVPLTTRPLGPRADSPASSRSSRSSGGRKRRRRAPQVADVDASQEVSPQEPVPSNPIDVGDDTPSWENDDQDPDVSLVQLNGNAVAGPSKPSAARHASPPPTRPSTPPPSNLLSTHTCPICFSPITKACLTPCGHVLCATCLFASVKSGIQRSLASSIPIGAEGTAARCPVCRAVLKGWDGRGGGVIPLKIRTIVAL